MQYDKDKIKNSLSIDQIYSFLTDHGGEPILKGNYIISRTICHNPAGYGSHKLYYYNNTKLFKCFTDCSNSFDIFELVCKIKNLEQKNKIWKIYDAIIYVSKFFGIEENKYTFDDYKLTLPDWQILQRYDDNKIEYKKIVELKKYNKDILKYLPTPRIIPWEEEGIKREIMLHRGIAYDPSNQGIIIPHYDINNELIGIRERTLIKDREDNGKYRPAIINYKMYNHPLSFNLYNLNNSKNNIKKIKKVIVFEGKR